MDGAKEGVGYAILASLSQTKPKFLNPAPRVLTMNQSFKLLSTALLTSALLASSALAFSYKTVASTNPFTAPLPSDIVAPALATADAGQSLRVRLTIDEKGQASDVRVLSSVDRALNRRIVKAVEQWRFEPALRDGKAVKVRAVMPIELKLDQAS